LSRGGRATGEGWSLVVAGAVAALLLHGVWRRRSACVWGPAMARGYLIPCCPATWFGLSNTSRKARGYRGKLELREVQRFKGAPALEFGCGVYALPWRAHRPAGVARAG
jgi:hypothetical protein